MTFAIYLLGLHPEIQQRAREEVIDILGEIDNIPPEEMIYPTDEQQIKFRYLNRVIKETMRLYPPVSALPFRSCTRDILLSDDRTQVPKGSYVGIDFMGQHREKDIWGPNANEFDPDRWPADEDGVTHPGGQYGYAWTPFGGGQRICLGQQFSIIEQRTILAMLLLRYQWKVVGDAKAMSGNPDSVPGILLHAKGIQIQLKRR